MKVLWRPLFLKLKVCALLFALALTIIAPSPRILAQLPPETVDLAVLNRIKEEELSHSQIMDTVGYLTDVIGPRLTGSPGLKKAQAYSLDRLREFGAVNAHLEPWGPFGRGWSLEGFTCNMITPTFNSLIAYPKAWSPGTNGALRGEVVFLDVKTEADLARYKGKLKGKIVLLSPARPVEPNFAPLAQRTTDEGQVRDRRFAEISNEPGAAGPSRTELPKMAVAVFRRRGRCVGTGSW
jgi:carboxypeptidase Q